MDRPRQEPQIGAPWIAVMVLLAILLLLGVLLYVQMTSPLKQPGRRTTGAASHQVCLLPTDGGWRVPMETETSVSVDSPLLNYDANAVYRQSGGSAVPRRV